MALELIVQKRGGVLASTWTPGDTKEKKFKEVQKALSEEICVTLSCNCDVTLVPLERQLVQRKHLVYAFSMLNSTLGNT